jgi:hypothetical protein
VIEGEDLFVATYHHDSESLAHDDKVATFPRELLPAFVAI